MSSAIKLTKKQKKGLAFRERKSGKGSRDGAAPSLETDGVPVMEIQDTGDQDADDMESPLVGAQTTSTISKAAKGKGKQKQKDVDLDQPAAASGSKKRRREEDGVASEGVLAVEKAADSPKAKKRKANSGEAVKKDNSKQKFILFLGNLRYTTSKEAIAKHFEKCDPPPNIRLLTPKASANNKPMIKSKGCAFLEFSHRNALQQALKLHHSQLDGRQINVELTAGGGGNSDARLTKVKERNKGLFDQRKEKLEKEDNQDGVFSIQRPQRFSMTSGIEQVQLKKRTWTVVEEDDGQTHRGGQKHKKKGGSKSKSWGTGVNSIPVG